MGAADVQPRERVVRGLAEQTYGEGDVAPE
jgi:hypothetical protein